MMRKNKKKNKKKQKKKNTSTNYTGFNSACLGWDVFQCVQ